MCQLKSYTGDIASLPDLVTLDWTINMNLRPSWLIDILAAISIGNAWSHFLEFTVVSMNSYQNIVWTMPKRCHRYTRLSTNCVTEGSKVL